MWEADQWLDTDAYLLEQQLWTHSSLHCEYLLLQMFQPTVASSQSAHEHAICQGQWEPSPEWDLLAEPLPWSSSVLTPGIKTSKPCIVMSTNYARCQVEAGVKGRWQSGLVRRFCIPSRSASGFSGHPSSRWGSRCSSQPIIPGLILPQLLPLPTKESTRRLWHLQRMPNNEPLQWLQSSRKGWVIPPTANASPSINALPARGGPDPLDSKERVPRWIIL